MPARSAPSRTACPPHWRAPAVLWLLLLVAASAGPAQARWHDSERGTVYFSGAGSLYYGRATTMVAGVGIIGLRSLYIAELFDDDQDWVSHDQDRCRCGRSDDPWCDDFDMPVEGHQFGGSVGVFVAPGLAVGWRLLTQQNDPADRVRSFWGGGPEISVHGPAGAIVRPFASIGALYTWERSGDRRRERGPARTALLLRTGIGIPGPRSAFYLETSYLAPASFDGHEPASVSRPWGIGLGFSVSVH